MKDTQVQLLPCHSKVCACLCFVDHFFVRSGLCVHRMVSYQSQRQLLRQNGGGFSFDTFLSNYWSFLTLFFEMEKGYSFLLGFGYLGDFFWSLFLGRTWDKDGRKGYDDVCVKPLMYCMCELVFPWGNVNPGLINPLPPARRSRRARRSSLDLKWQIPPNKETSRPDDNYDWLYEEILDHASLVWLPVLPRPMEGGVY